MSGRPTPYTYAGKYRIMQNDNVYVSAETLANNTKEHQTLNARSLRALFGNYPTGVAIVTTRSSDGRPVGLTINSFASVSLDPALALWSLANTSSNYDTFRNCEHFAIHFLAAGDHLLATRFATPSITDKFAEVTYQDSDHGVPLLDSAMTTLLCKQNTCMDAGDHLVLIGKITKAWSRPEQPLVFHQGRFVELARCGG